MCVWEVEVRREKRFLIKTLTDKTPQKKKNLWRWHFFLVWNSISCKMLCTHTLTSPTFRDPEMQPRNGRKRKFRNCFPLKFAAGKKGKKRGQVDKTLIFNSVSATASLRFRERRRRRCKTFLAAGEFGHKVRIRNSPKFAKFSDKIRDVCTKA